MKPDTGRHAGRDGGAVDPITLEIISSALRSITDETFVALTKSAYSTNIKERRDHSTAIMDPNGRLIAEAAQALPIHIASMNGLVACLLEKFRGDIHEGDLFIANDPHTAGGTHLPDIGYALPVFVDGGLFGFVANVAHHADIGGMAPGSMAGGMSEIFQEGLRIPVIKLFRRGELQSDILDLLLLNVRVPEERRGDHYAQIAACRLGARRLLEVVDHYSTGVIRTAFDEIVARTERRLRAAIAEVPDGRYTFEDVMDGDGVETVDIPIRLEVVIAGDRAHFDFAGTSPQVKGNVNVTMNATRASVCYALKAMLDPDVPNNEGVLAVAEIVAEPGTMLNAGFPAPVASRAHTCQRIIDVVLGAFRDALPDRVIGAANGANTTAVFAGTDPRSGNGYLYLETLGGGMGGRVTKDGKDGVQVGITNTSNLPVEAIEQEYPLRVEEYKPGRELRRGRPPPRRDGAAPRGPSGRSRLHLQRGRRTLPPPAVGRVRRRARRIGAVPAARRRRSRDEAPRQVRGAPARTHRGGGDRDPRRRRLRPPGRAQPRSGRRGSGQHEVHGRFHHPVLW